MSRNAPFPTVSSRRPRSPPPIADATSYQNGIPPTQPLSISRPRPRSPANLARNSSPTPGQQTQSQYGNGSVGPGQPLRPARSDRRPRQAPSVAGYDASGNSASYGSPSTSYPDPNGNANGASHGGRRSPAPPPSRYDQQPNVQRRDRDRSDTQSSRRTDGDPYGGMTGTPTSLSSPLSPGSAESPRAVGWAISAFQQRKGTSGSEGLANDREMERQQDKARREKLRQKEKLRGKTTGGIDGTFSSMYLSCTPQSHNNFQLCSTMSSKNGPTLWKKRYVA